MQRIQCMLVAAAALIATGAAHAQTYPAKPVRYVVGFVAGGNADSLGRLVAARLGEILGQQVVVENRPGAAAMVATDLVAKSSPDGYTILQAGATFATNPALRKSVPYDAQKDFAPVSMIARVANVFAVHPSLPAKSVGEFVAYAKARPGQITYGTPGVGSTGHLTVALLQSMTGIVLSHVPYKGGAPALTDLIGGQITALCDNVPSPMPYIKSGRIRALGVTSAQRVPQLPEVPTIAESGVPGFDVASWYAVWTPAGTPQAIITKLNASVVAALGTPDVKQRITDLGYVPTSSTVAELAAILSSETVQWAKVVKEAGIAQE